MSDVERQPLLAVENLQVSFPVPQKRASLLQHHHTFNAVDGMSFKVYPGEILGIVGESGCGKSTLGRAILGLVPRTSGQILYAGMNLLSLNKSSWRNIRKEVQIIFQDPFSALNPRLTIREIIAEPLKTFYPALGRRVIRHKVMEILERVGLSLAYLHHYPHELSGGQCQRVGIARALILQPRLIICDEPVSALDISIQAQILNLLKDLQQDSGFSLIFISHNLSVVRYICDRVLVMYLGKAMELGETAAIFNHPKHPYTQLLLSAILGINPKERHLDNHAWLGEVPSPIHKPAGCVFHTRCPIAIQRCHRDEPIWAPYDTENKQDRSKVACWRAGESAYHYKTGSPHVD